MNQSMDNIAYVGIDIAKAKFDAHVLRLDGGSASRSFKNSIDGFCAVAEWSKRESRGVACHFVMEPTGRYHRELLYALREQELLASQVNGYIVRHYAISVGLCNKTDRVDARVLAHFGRERQPEVYALPSQENRDLTDLSRYLEALKKDLQSLKNTLLQPGLSPFVKRSLQERIAGLEEEIKLAQKEVERLGKSNADLKKDLSLLRSIPGIGQVTAMTMLAELPDRKSLKCAQSLAAYAGLNPKLNESGKFRGATHIARRGNGRLRTALYFPALTAMRWNPMAIALAKRLKERGKQNKQIIAAVMRKLLLIAYGVLKHQKPFEADFQSVAPARAAPTS